MRAARRPPGVGLRFGGAPAGRATAPPQIPRRRIAPLLVGALLVGCGVAGRPLPPGPAAPDRPTELRVRATADGFEVTARLPTRDLDGEPLGADPAVRLAVFVDRADCRGVPDAVGAPPLRLTAARDRPVDVRVVALRGRQAGPVARTHARWGPPPPPPEPPLAFVDAAGAVQLSWLPPPPPVDAVRVLRDGVRVAEAPADAAAFTDAAPAGEHAYALVALTPDAASAPSAAARVRVPAQEPR